MRDRQLKVIIGEKPHTSCVVDAQTGETIAGVFGIQVDINPNDTHFRDVPIVTIKLIARSDYGCIVEVERVEAKAKPDSTQNVPSTWSERSLASGRVGPKESYGEKVYHE
jgi:hypothetical protein